MKEITTTIKQKVAEWNNISASIRSSLFLADSYEPKPIPDGSSAEVAFWYDVTNLYSLFADCMPYLHKAGTQFNRTQIKLIKADSWLDLMQNNGFLRPVDAQMIRKFITAIKEVRSCFCHNKHIASFNEKIITDGLGVHIDLWEFYPHLGCKRPFSFELGSDLLLIKAKLVIAAIDKTLRSVKGNSTDTLIDNWSKSIAAWYLSSNDIIYRGLLLYRKSGLIPTVKYGFEKMETTAISMLAKSKGITSEALVQDIHYDLTDEVIFSSARATPENVLYRLFDALI